MRITCANVDDFLNNLDDGVPFRGVVHYSNTHHELNADGSSRELFYQLSAVVQYADTDGEALLESGESCGIDRDEKDDPKDGSTRRNALHNTVVDYCKSRGWEVRPGKLDM